MNGPPARSGSSTPPPGFILAQAIWSAVAHRLALEWHGSTPHLLALRFPKPLGLAARPKPLRPADPEKGRQILFGRFRFFGETLISGHKGDPWDRPSPSRTFAEELHGYSWLPDLLAVGEEGTREALRLISDWRRVFGRWNAFAWEGEALERRVFHLACALPVLAAPAADAEVQALMMDLARQARHLAGAGGGPVRAAERAAAVALAGTVLAGRPGEGLMRRGLARLARALKTTVLPDGGHAGRSPSDGMALLYDLLVLDDALSQRGRPAPEEMSRAIDRLFAALKVFALADGRLPAMQGGDEGVSADVRHALAEDDSDAPVRDRLEVSGYHRMQAGALQVFVDAGAPARGVWSAAAAAQPMALEIIASGRRLITNVGWTDRCHATHALRLTDGASTASLGDASAGEPLRGFQAEQLGPRLIGAPAEVSVERQVSPEGDWLDMSHEGWVSRFGLIHERRLFLSAEGELRGEDRFTPKAGPPKVKGPRRYAPFTVRFHLYPEVSASVALDKRSVLLKAGADAGWWLRNDATDVVVEPSMHFAAGEMRRTQQIVLRGQVMMQTGGRVRWKLTRAEG